MLRCPLNTYKLAARRSSSGHVTPAAYLPAHSLPSARATVDTRRPCRLSTVAHSASISHFYIVSRRRFHSASKQGQSHAAPADGRIDRTVNEAPPQRASRRPRPSEKSSDILRKSNSNSPSYLRDTSVRVRDIERVLASPALAGDILDRIHSGALSAADSDAMQSLVRAAVAWASSTYSDEAYNFLVQTWQIVFHEQASSPKLVGIRTTLQENEDRLIHMMVNRGEFATYAQLVAPLYRSRPAALRSWAMTLMETLRPTASGGGRTYTADHRGIYDYIGADTPTREEKHRMVAVFMTKTLMSASSRQNMEHALRGLVDYFGRLENGVFVFGGKWNHIYRRPLVLLADVGAESVASPTAAAQARIKLIHQVFAEHASSAELSDFLTALSHACADLSPHIAISSWQFKQAVLNRESKGSDSDFRTIADLTSTMRAYIKLRAYDKALAAYAEHSHLQDDEQIELLLRASEKTKDWKLLQSQFEDMYGRGNLPYVVHYAVVMGALASIGSFAEVEQLYAQLLRRKLEPTASIFLALVRANINANRYEEATRWYGEFSAAVESGAIPQHHVVAVRLELLESRLQSMSVAAALSELQLLVQQQAQTQTPHLGPDTMRTMIRFVSSVYSLEGFEAVWQTACKLSLVDDHVYSEAITFLTKMGHFQRADNLALEAHLDSAVPFQNALILSSQLHNYRQWLKEVTDRATKGQLSDKIYGIIAKTERGAVSPRNLGSLLVEIIKHFTSAGRPEKARPFLDMANARNISTERHFVPFLKEYSGRGSYDDNSDVLDLYQEMVSRKTVISARTYYYLSKSLLVIDAANKGGHQNSYNLLVSVLEMYGFGTTDDHGVSKVSVADLSRKAIFLLQIVSDYVVEASAHDQASMDLVLNFLKQIRAKLDRNVDYSFRVSILTEMSKVYRVYGDLKVARSLVDNALSEMDDVVAQLPACDPLPKLLQLDYRKAVELKTTVMGQDSAPWADYNALLAHVVSKNVRLSSYQLHNLNNKVLSAEPLPRDSLRVVLDGCERFLVQGSWAEVKLSRKIYHIYRLLLVYLGRTMSAEAITARYELLNQLYDIPDVNALLREFKHIRHPREELEQALREYNVMRPREEWTPDKFFEGLAEFFAPERQHATRNFIQPNLAAELVRKIEGICGGNNAFAFELYDEYPETMEYLLFYVGERTRVVKFRIGINKIHGSQESAPVDGRAARRQRAVETLQHLWGSAQGGTAT